jgi:hypothetical protein
MKLAIFMIPVFLFLQSSGCSDDSSDDGGSINENFVEFAGVRYEASGGCNVESINGQDASCVYAGAFRSGGLGYAIAISHEGFCRSATFNLRDNLDQPSHAYFVMQITEDGVAIETFLGTSGTIDLTDSGNVSSIDFAGTITSVETGMTESIEGYLECPI